MSRTLTKSLETIIFKKFIKKTKAFMIRINNLIFQTQDFDYIL